jgi:hypothetical protein
MTTIPLKDVGHLTKFDGSNFTRWQQGLFLTLEQHDLLNIVNGTETKPIEVITDLFSDISHKAQLLTRARRTSFPLPSGA